MKSTTVSIRLPNSELAQIDRLSKELSVERASMIRRFITAGLCGLLRYEDSGDSFDWPRTGRISMDVLPVGVSTEEDVEVVLAKRGAEPS
jgi:hypothetical protein